MKVFLVAAIALIGVSVCAAGGGGPSSQYLPPNYAGSAPQPSNQYLAPHSGGAGGAGGAHYHGVDGGAHYAAAASHHAPSASSRYGGGQRHGGGGAPIPILRNDFTHDVSSGNYNFGFETGNGIRRDETGEFIGGWPHGSPSVKGSYSYTGDDGRTYTVNYTADEHGFHAEGDHLPTNSQSHGGAGGHGRGYSRGPAGGNGGHHHHHAGAASGHAPSSQYLPPQQHGGYNYARHRSH